MAEGLDVDTSPSFRRLYLVAGQELLYALEGPLGRIAGLVVHDGHAYVERRMHGFSHCKQA